jgi:agmatine deiminase
VVTPGAGYGRLVRPRVRLMGTHMFERTADVPDLAAAGWRMPAEWEPHEATWLAWPHKEASWPERIERIHPVYAQFVAELARSETVHISVNDAAAEQAARAHLAAAAAVGDIRFHHFPTNDAWCRDHGAIFVTRTVAGRRELAATKWLYNAWGDKYPPYDLDNQIPARMAAALGVPLFSGGMVLEGGSIEVDGNGLLLTSEQCLLNENRNPDLARDEIERRLKRMFGVHTVLWLGDGIVGDDTDGHIDDIARFVAPATVLTAIEDDPADENYAVLQENLARLQTMRDAAGRPLTILTLPMPPAQEIDGQRLPASYANYYLSNDAVIVPFYGHDNDRRAAEVLAGCFPTRRVVGIDCRDIIWGLGAWHCLSQQVPSRD